MEWWQAGMVANGVIAVAYFLIFGAIVLPLVRGRQLRKNPLGTATAAIFLTCAVHHGVHAVHMVMPVFGLDLVQGNAMRAAWTWQLAVWDVVGAVVATYYWSLRRTYGSLMQGAQLFEDMKRREEQALEINDTILQGIVVAKMALDLGDRDRAMSALDSSISSASHLVTDLLGPGHLPASRMTRSQAATIQPSPRDGDGGSRGG
ncbi:hypothetical protein [Nocardioides marmoribigeumensis]|uniref:Signal transduction histidine kinase subgroup 3 dimerisation and phosphoacceptor domain-containing protein n=1 Tax=Nocardioides marmoribigeumensis TaxID=433649 RepID=A0ABU2BZ33_9ACTN|nr:hypothetical protein [Nocardioides marmoribigeumensis]MDR7363658.1 hypothetical protein [Nocardioides marmoribigeumensis]